MERKVCKICNVTKFEFEFPFAVGKKYRRKVCYYCYSKEQRKRYLQRKAKTCATTE